MSIDVQAQGAAIAAAVRRGDSRRAVVLLWDTPAEDFAAVVAVAEAALT